MSSLANTSAKLRAVLQRLRIPCARSAALLYAYSAAVPVNPGITLLFPEDERTVVAPGDGKVVTASLAQPTWAYSPTSLHVTQGSYQVVIDHGGGVRSVVHGLRTCSVYVGQQVQRGQGLGERTDREVFFAIVYVDKPYDPIGINRHIQTQNGNVVLGQGGLFRFAPDLLARDLSNGIVATLVDGYNYFVSSTCEKPPFLLNIDFNGNGHKTGFAAVGISENDVWNVYAPASFQPTSAGTPGYWCSGQTFSTTPVVNLVDYTGSASPVWLERQSLAAAAGTTAWFDVMLSRWIGGYDGLGSPYENTFSLRNVPIGDFVLCLYANEGTPPTASSFYVSVNADSPSLKTNTPANVSAFVNNTNYVQYSLTLAVPSTIHIRVYGYLAGLQLKRV